MQLLVFLPSSTAALRSGEPLWVEKAAECPSASLMPWSTFPGGQWVPPTRCPVSWPSESLKWWGVGLVASEAAAAVVRRQVLSPDHAVSYVGGGDMLSVGSWRDLPWPSYLQHPWLPGAAQVPGLL